MKKLSLLFLLLTAACGYHMVGQEKSERVAVSVPYIEGDFTGYFTEELIRSLSSSSKLNFDARATYKLVVCILDENMDRIGYRYDRENDGTLKKNLLPIEGRQKIRLKVTILPKEEEKPIFGPFEMEEDIDFDYVEENSLRDLSFLDHGVRRTVLSYSLGQLESIGAAQDAAKVALYRKVAKRVVELIDAKLPNEL